ncbi:protein kinase [Patescibacteria group bacterium]|nr:protein kinase [Patescibacteria group bacterium]
MTKEDKSGLVLPTGGRQDPHVDIQLQLEPQESGLDLPTGGGAESEVDQGLVPSGATLCGKYLVLRLLGQGAFAEVYEVVLISGEGQEQKYALKVFFKDKASKLDDELEALERLDYPDIVKLYNLEWAHEVKRWCLVMELVEGYTLRQIMDAEKLRAQFLPDEREAYQQLFAVITKALRYAHGQKIIHRDLKPANIMLTMEGQVKILDFGIAKVIEEKNKATSMTVGAGTAYYMAPEQLAGKEVTPATDSYSLGVLLYELACGTVPSLVEAFDDFEKKGSRLQAVFNLEEMSSFLYTCLSPKPQVRPQSALKFREQFLRCFQEKGKAHFVSQLALLQHDPTLETSFEDLKERQQIAKELKWNLWFEKENLKVQKRISRIARGDELHFGPKVSKEESERWYILTRLGRFAAGALGLMAFVILLGGYFLTVTVFTLLAVTLYFMPSLIPSRLKKRAVGFGVVFVVGIGVYVGASYVAGAYFEHVTLWDPFGFYEKLYRIKPFAGTTAGFKNGPKEQAKFRYPYGMAVDKAGNLYVADYGNHVIRKIDQKGIVSTYAGVPMEGGYKNGARLKAKFSRPTHLAFDDRNKIFYVSDTGNAMVRKIDSKGKVTTFLDLNKLSKDSVHKDGLFGLTVDYHGNVVVGTSLGRIQVFDKRGKQIYEEFRTVASHIIKKFGGIATVPRPTHFIPNYGQENMENCYIFLFYADPDMQICRNTYHYSGGQVKRYYPEYSNFFRVNKWRKRKILYVTSIVVSSNTTLSLFLSDVGNCAILKSVADAKYGKKVEAKFVSKIGRCIEKENTSDVKVAYNHSFHPGGHRCVVNLVTLHGGSLLVSNTCTHRIGIIRNP